MTASFGISVDRARVRLNPSAFWVRLITAGIGRTSNCRVTG